MTAPRRRLAAATALPSPYTDPSPITREDPASRTGADADARPRAYTRARVDPQGGTGRDVEVAALALAAALQRVRERRDALAATVAAARAGGVGDTTIRAHLVIAGLPESEADDALR